MQTKTRALEGVKVGDKVIVGKSTVETVRAVTSTTIKAGRFIQTFTIATGKGIGNNLSARLPKPGELEAMESAWIAEQEQRQAESARERAEATEREKTPLWKLAKKVCNSNQSWDMPFAWYDLGEERLRQVAEWLGIKE